MSRDPWVTLQHLLEDQLWKVRGLILVTEEQEITEDEWLRAAASNAAFDFLQSPAEDIYTLDDGKPFHDEG